MTQFFCLSTPVKMGILVLILGSGEILDSNLFLGSHAFGGGALYIPILLALFVSAIALYRKDRVAGMAMFVAALVWCVSLTARSLDSFTLPLVTYAEKAQTPEASATSIGASQNSDDANNRRFDYSVCNPMSEDGYKAAVGERLVEGKNGIYHRYTYYPYHLGTHFLWHITNAIVLYLFASILILYGPKTSRSR